MSSSLFSLAGSRRVLLLSVSIVVLAGPAAAANINNTTPNTTGIVLNDQDSLTNSSSITDTTGTHDPAVLSNGSDDIVSINNGGTIAGAGTSAIAIGGDGIFGAPDANADLQTFLNTGTVTAGSATYASALKVGGNVGDFTNKGTMTADRFDTVRIYNDLTGTFLNDTGAKITALSDSAVTIRGTANAIVNKGSIKLTSTFLDEGLYVGGLTQSFNNSGTVDAPVAVRLQGGLVTGSNSGTITGGTMADAAGVNIQSTGGTFTNSGTISGYYGFILGINTAGGTLINKGKIHGESGGAAVRLSNSDDKLVLETTSVIEGLVNGADGTDTLTFGGTGTATFDASLLGDTSQYRSFETFRKEGTSDWTFTGNNSGMMHFTVVAGRLGVNGNMANTSIGVGSGGTIGGIGTVAATSVDGTIAPGLAGNGVGTLNTGNLRLDTSSTYAVNVAGGVADRINVNGAVTLLDGAVTVAGAGPGGSACGPGGTVSLAILTATGTITGTFGSVTAATGSPTLRYDQHNVYLDYTTTGGTASSYGPQGKTANQKATGYALDALGCGMQPYAAELAALAAGDVPGALEALSGEGHASIAGVLTENSHYISDAINDRIDQAFDALNTTGVVSNFAGEPMTLGGIDGVTVWGSTYGGFLSRDGNGNAGGAQSLAAGLVLGADGKVSEDWRLGLLGGLGYTGISAKATTGQSTDLSVGGYAGGELGEVTIKAGAAYTRHLIETSRSIVFPGVNDTVAASYQAGTAQAFLEVSHDFEVQGATVSPFVTLEAVNHATDAFKETGGAGALSVAASVTNAFFVTLGVAAEDKFVLGDGLLVTAHGSLGWRHAFSDGVKVANSFTGGGPFSISAAPIASDVAVITGGLTFDLTEQLSLSVNYDGQVGSGVMLSAVKATLAGKL